MAHSTDPLKLTRIPRERVERAARLYNSAKDAALAIGILPSSFRKMCQQYGVELPSARRARKLQEMRAAHSTNPIITH